ncbi:hypothetical protein BH23BAC4_BH23BAC4_13070 [soil metagenome]
MTEHPNEIPRQPAQEPLSEADEFARVEVPVEPEEDLTPDAVSERFLLTQARRIPLTVFGVMVLLGAMVLLLSRGELTAQIVPAGEREAELPIMSLDRTQPFTFRSLEIHPDRLHAGSLGGAFLVDATSSDSEGGEFARFRAQLRIYEQRQGVDDNFAIRVLDERTDETLEVYSLRGLRSEYQLTGQADWDQIDRQRRAATNNLLQKWVARGVPREHVIVRWGRADQVAEARQRENAYIEYEVQLARMLGLSLLSTEIGTVETFNQDHLISSAGARSRYQMMPDILRRFNLRQYSLPLAGGGSLNVREELNTLLAMEPSFTLLKGYANAVGHEVPGISAYHTGPGNIFVLYQAYARAMANRPPERPSVVSAYMWGVTDGFDRVRAQSSFGPHSRAYVLQAYGSLRAAETKPIDPSLTLRTERVQLQSGTSISLTQLLERLEQGGDRLDWGADNTASNLYERFRRLNRHLGLPRSASDATVDVPAAGNARLTAEAGGGPVRFFLPYGASDFLARVGTPLLNDSALFRFDQDAYNVDARDRLDIDREYTRLVEDIKRFGFTTRNRNRLSALRTQMRGAAEANPTNFRQLQAQIIDIHFQIWSTRAFRDLSATTDLFLSALPDRQRAGAMETTAQADTSRIRPIIPITLAD